MLTPILVLGAARTGSTALMSLLGGSPRIAFDKRYPYEATYLSYLALVAKVVGGPRKPRSAAWRRTTLVTGISDTVGSLPFQTKGFVERRQLTAAAFTGLWRSFSKVLIDQATDRGEEPPTHFAEKAGYFTVSPAVTRLGARQLHLLRDPRDMMISSKRFIEKRGKLGFGWLSDDTDASYARRFAQRVRQRMEAAIDIARDDPQRMVVRYEDLVLDQEGVARRISEFLGIPLDPAAQLAAIEAHRTSADPASSVGRWRREMDDQVKAIFDKRLGDILDRAGYGRADAASPPVRRNDRK